MFRNVLALSLVSSLAVPVAAQCFSLGGQQPLPGLWPISQVYDIEAVDPDGSGPQTPVLLIGGWLAGVTDHGWQWNGTVATPVVSQPVRQFAGSSTGTWYALREDNIVEVRSPSSPSTTISGFLGQINGIAVANGTLWAGGRVIGINGDVTPVLTRLTAGRWQTATPPGLLGNIFALTSQGTNIMLAGVLARDASGSVPLFSVASQQAFYPSGMFVATHLTSSQVQLGQLNPNTLWVTDGFTLAVAAGQPSVSVYSQSATITSIEGTELGLFFGTDTGVVYRVDSNWPWINSYYTTPIGIAANGPIYAIETYQNDLYIAGAFTQVNGQPAIGVARLLNTGAPQFTQQPSNQQVFATETLTLAAPVANATDVTFQWFLGSIPLGNGLSQNGQLIAGANTPVLTIQRPRVTMSGVYTLRATNPCGTTTSSPAVVTVVPACDSIDFNNDDVFPDDQDVVAFFRVLAGGQCFE